MSSFGKIPITMAKEIDLQILYNKSSGTGLALKLASETSTIPLDKYPISNEIIVQDIRDELPKINNPTLTLIYGGDGTYFKYLAQHINDPNSFIIPMGGGGENVVARQLNTLGKSPIKVLDQVFSSEDIAVSFQKISPWQAENENTGEIINFFWLFGVGGSVITQALQQIEKYRDSTPHSYHLRLAQAMIGMLAQAENRSSLVVMEKQFSSVGAESLITTGLIHALAMFPLQKYPQVLHVPHSNHGRPYSIPVISGLVMADLAFGIQTILRHPLSPETPVTLINVKGDIVADSNVFEGQPNTCYLITQSPKNYNLFPKPIND